MTVPSEFDNAKQAVSLLFKRIGVKKVVCIDDIYSKIGTDEEILGICKLLRSNQKLKFIEGLSDIPFEDDSDDGAPWRTPLETLLSKKTAPEKNALFLEMQKLRGEEDSASKLGDLVNPIEFNGLSPETWASQRDALIQEAQSNTTLFLFDRCLKPGNDLEMGGEELLKEFLTKDQKSFCGILSQTFSEDNEHKLWKEFCSKGTVDGSRFVFVSKTRLSDVPMSFPFMLRLMLLNKNFNLIKSSVLKVMDEANESADKTIQEFDIYQIEQFLFNSAESEGVWEPDTLMRLHWLYQKKYAMSKLRADTDAHTAANEVRGVRKDVREKLKDTEAWKVLRLENFEDGSLINSVLAPIDLGDVFEIEGKPDVKFILIAQPCDLMVRPDGNRGKEGELVWLAEVKKDKPPKEQTHLSFELKYFSDQTGSSWFVYFNRVHNVALNVLDTSATNQDGACSLKWIDPTPFGLIPAWQERYALLTKEFGKVSIILDTIKGNQDAIKMVLRGEFHFDESFPEPIIDPANSKISFGIKRVARMISPKAQEMLIKYTQCLSRFAYEHEININENNKPFVAPPPVEATVQE